MLHLKNEQIFEEAVLFLNHGGLHYVVSNEGEKQPSLLRFPLQQGRPPLCRAKGFEITYPGIQKC